MAYSGGMAKPLHGSRGPCPHCQCSATAHLHPLTCPDAETQAEKPEPKEALTEATLTLRSPLGTWDSALQTLY